MRILLALLLAITSVQASPQIMPRVGDDNPRLQNVEWQEGQPVALTALPMTGLTVMLDPVERIERVQLSNEQDWSMKISAELNSFLLTPAAAGGPGLLEVQTDRRTYHFQLSTGTGLEAALLVQFNPTAGSALPMSAHVAMAMQATSSQSWSYRLRGSRSVRPLSISDDGRRTRIEFAPDQALPAVFAIGATGEEEIVNGHMRNGTFEIDRVHQELVFRIDRDRARALRNSEPEAGS